MFGRHNTPASPCLIPDAPELQPPGLLSAVFLPQCGHRIVAIGSKILNPLRHFFHRATSDVSANDRLASDLVTQIHELMRPEAVVFRYSSPIRIHHLGTIGARTDAVPPMVLVGETAARPAHVRDVKFAQRRHDIVADAAGVRNRRVLAHPDAAVDAVTEVLRKLPVDKFADGVPGGIGMHDQRIYF